MMTNKMDLQKISEQFSDEYANKIKKFSNQQTIIGIFIILFVLISFYTISNDRSVRSKSGSIIANIDIKSMTPITPVLLLILKFFFKADDKESMNHKLFVLFFVVGFWIVFLLLIKYDKYPNSKEKIVPEPARKSWEKYTIILGFMVLLMDCVFMFL